MTHRVTLALALVLASASVAFAADPAGRIGFHRVGEIVPDAFSRGNRLSAPSAHRNSFAFCCSGPGVLLDRRADD